MSRERMEIGQRAESLVADRLSGAGYEILARNARVGRLELDIVARKGRLLVICEVRARTGRFDPAESIDARKQAKVRRAARAWIASARPRTSEVRFDAAAVTFGPDGTAQVSYYEGAFE